MIIEILTILLLTVTAMIFGYGYSASAVSHPAMLESGPKVAVPYFKPFFHKSNHTQLILSMAVWALSSAISYLTGEWSWLIAGTLLQISGPYTILIIMPVNRRIMAEGADPESPQMIKDLKNWGTIHFPRTLMAGAVFIYFAYLAVFN
ncbi:MAG: DUF1772 domain-containing protein [Cohaesibacter sp.]|nr:DUF1772 domain-containing protein [Cohaesibacter sp.]MCV6602054.1 DUF1772 domain-containing protein [Cohaesibacter sp.]